MTKQTNDDLGRVLSLLQKVSDSVENQTHVQTQAQLLLGRELGEIKETINSLKQQTNRIEQNVSEHSGTIRTIEKENAGWRSELKNIWDHIKRFNAFMDFARNKNLDVDTGMIDVKAQQIQHAAEMAIRNDFTDSKKIFFKWAPWVLFAMFASSAIGGALAMKFFGDDDIQKRIDKIEKTNLGSH